MNPKRRKINVRQFVDDMAGVSHDHTIDDEFIEYEDSSSREEVNDSLTFYETKLREPNDRNNDFLKRLEAKYVHGIDEYFFDEDVFFGVDGGVIRNSNFEEKYRTLPTQKTQFIIQKFHNELCNDKKRGL